jgi:hypothetical protein
LLRPNAAVAASHQFGAGHQTDVFVIGQDGDGTNKKLYMFSVNGAGQWREEQEISTGPYRPSSQGAFVAASEQFGAPNQTDVFILNETGTNGPGWPAQFWVGGSGPWGGPVALVTEA